MPFPRDRKIHAARTTVNVAVFQAGFADCGIVDDRQKARRIGHQYAIKESLVIVEQADQIDITVEVGGFVPQLLQDPANLEFFRLGDFRDETRQPERLTLGLCVSRRLVDRWIVKNLDPA